MKIKYVLVTMLIFLLPVMAYGLDIDTDSNDCVDWEYGGTNNNSTTAFLPDDANGMTLGSAAKEWSDGFFSDGAVLYFGDDQDVTLTHTADTGLSVNLNFSAATYGSNGSVSDAELLYINTLSSNAQDQLDVRCLESVFGTALEADDLQLNGTTLELTAEIPHTDATQTWSGVQTFADLTLSSLTAAPGSPVGGAWYRADDATWDPVGLSLGYDYFVIYDDNATAYKATFDERGALHATSITTVETEFIPISWMDITDGGADPPESLYATDSNSREVKIATFDGATDENLSFVWGVPLDISGTTIKYRWHGIVTNATGPSSENISFQLSCISVADGEQLDFAAYGDAIATTETVTEVQDDLITSAWSAAVTPTGLAAGEIVHCLLNRDADGNDTYAQDFGLIGIDIKYVRLHNATF